MVRVPQCAFGEGILVPFVKELTSNYIIAEYVKPRSNNIILHNVRKESTTIIVLDGITK